MTNFIKGNELMLFDSTGKSYAYATNHTLSLTADASDVSSKDHGMWGSSEVTKFSWEITSENIFTEADFGSFFDKWQAGEKLTVIFGIKKETDNSKTVVDGDYTNWVVSTTGTTGYYKGDVIVTSLEANASNGENATYSVTLTGVGKFARCTDTVSATDGAKS